MLSIKKKEKQKSTQQRMSDWLANPTSKPVTLKSEGTYLTTIFWILVPSVVFVWTI